MRAKLFFFQRVLGSLRWELFGLLCAACLAVLVSRVLWPLGREVFDTVKALQEKRLILGQSGALEHRLTQLAHERASIDSLLAILTNRPAFDEAQTVGMLYQLADSAGCKAGKVEIGEPIELNDIVEIPIQFVGEGSYAAIGKLVAGVENLTYVSRIRTMSLQKQGDGDNGAVSIDFIVIEGNR